MKPNPRSQSHWFGRPTAKRKIFNSSPAFRSGSCSPDASMSLRSHGDSILDKPGRDMANYQLPIGGMKSKEAYQNQN